MAEPAGVAIAVHGLADLRSDLRRASKTAPRAMSKTNKETAQLVVPTAQQEAPEVEGGLRTSIRAGGRQLEGRVYAGKASVPYAGPIHFGWANRPNWGNAVVGPISPNPFLYRALDARRDEVIKRYEKAVDELIRANL